MSRLTAVLMRWSPGEGEGVVQKFDEILRSTRLLFGVANWPDHDTWAIMVLGPGDRTNNGENDRGFISLAIEP